MPTLPFTSLRHPVSVDAARGRLAQEQDFNAHIEQLVLQVLLTAPGGVAQQFPKDMANLGRLLWRLVGKATGRGGQTA